MIALVWLLWMALIPMFRRKPSALRSLTITRADFTKHVADAYLSGLAEGERRASEAD